ncbi:sigma-54-dependent Fis family transcriptional regulator [Marinifilum sp. JC120]|nr:sigma-54-dependent Fis family transcriptional regulator [Marinifilum sp. JC120]
MDSSIKIMIIEDDAIDARFIKTVLGAAGYDADVSQHPNEALMVLNQHPYDLILVDLKMVDMNGMQILELIKRYYPTTEVIIITAHASIDTAVEAIRMGAYSYFVKGDPARKLLADIKTIATRKMEKNTGIYGESSAGASRLKTRGATFTNILSQADQLAAVGMNVLLVGAPGTGKKNFAQHMCKSTPQTDGPVYETDFSVDGESLSQQNAKDRLNIFLDQYGSTGTCVLLNIDQADPIILSEMLSILETRISRYSSKKALISVISTSTLQSIPKLKATYGSEFFFLYWGIKLELPEIRERREDLPLIAEDIVKKLSATFNVPTPDVDNSLLEYLSAATFVREFEGLETLVQRIFKVSSGAALTSDLIEQVEIGDILLKEEYLIFPSEPSSLKEAREQSEREFIKTVYARSGGNKTRTAAALGISSRQLYNMLKKYDLED